ncbi:MAG: hypothetical protein ACYDCL_22660 [Myxococcales bacterium]
MRGGLVLLAATFTALPAQAATVWVAFPARAEPCSYDQLEGALRARLGEVDVRPGVHDALPGDVLVDLDHDGADWSLQVQAAGENELRRKLPRPGLDCVALSETAALMVDRYLDGIHWAGASPAVVQQVPPPPKAPAWQLVLQVGGSGELGVLPQLGPGLTLDVGARRGRFQIELSGSASLGGQETVACAPDAACPPGGTAGTLALQGAATQLALGYGLPVGFGTVRFELTPGAELFWVTTSPSPGSFYFRSMPAFSALPFVGVRLGYELPLSRRLFLALRVEARGHLGEDQFSVTGSTTEFTRLFDGDASLALGYLFF